MPVASGRPVLLALALLAGATLGAGPAVGAKKHHRRARMVATKSRTHGHVPGVLARRPPLVGTLPAAGPGSPASPPADTTPTTTTPAPACPTAVGVSEGEFFTQPSRTKLCAGKVTWELDNVGMDDHDLEVLNVATGSIVGTWDVVHPGAHAAQSLTLPAGTYRLLCTLSSDGQSHDALGMNAILTVS